MNLTIIDYLKKNGFITRVDVEVLCGFSNSSSKRILRKLRNENSIELVSRSRASRYVLTK